jgi:peptide/nickel transport system substrate-binding protein
MGKLNFIIYFNPEVEELIDRARFFLDRDVRKAAFDRFQAFFYEKLPKLPYVFLFVPDSLVALSSRFVSPETALITIGYSIKEWWESKELKGFTS